MTQKWLFLVRVQIPVVIFDSQDNMWWQANDISPSVVLSRLAIAQLDVKHFDFTDIALEITISVHEARKELVKDVNFPQALLSNHQEGGCWELHLGPLEKQSSFQISFLHFWTQDYIYIPMAIQKLNIWARLLSNSLQLGQGGAGCVIQRDSPANLSQGLGL